MIITDIKELKIQYNEPLRLLRLEWKTTADMRRLLPVLDQVHELAKRLQVTHALLSLEHLPDLSAYDQIWIGTHWMPKIMKLPLQQTVVVLHLKQVYNQHAIETIIKLSRPFMKFDIHFFNHSTSGMHWLLEDSPYQVALLAEWDEAFNPEGPPQDEVAEPSAAYRRPEHP